MLSIQLHIIFSQFLIFAVASATASATDEAVLDSVSDSEGGNKELGFVDVGYVAGVHGVQGEIRVKPVTDFPQLRFSTVQ